MEKKRGQALIEFVIILPIMIFLILAIIDIGKILYIKTQLESNMNTVIESYQNNSLSETKQLFSKDKMEIEITKDSEKYTKIELKKEVSIVTPGLNLIFSNPYFVIAERMILNES